MGEFKASLNSEVAQWVKVWTPKPDSRSLISLELT